MQQIICEKCGREMTNLSKGPYIEIKCPYCGWGWATYDSSHEPKAKYPAEILILPNQYDANKAKRLSRLVTGNAIEAKRLLEQGGTVLVNSPETIKALDEATITFHFQD